MSEWKNAWPGIEGYYWYHYCGRENRIIRADVQAGDEEMTDDMYATVYECGSNVPYPMNQYHGWWLGPLVCPT